MAPNTDTFPSDAGTAVGPATSPPDTRPPSRRRRGVLGWAAAVAALAAATALAVAVLAGGDDADTPVAPFDPQAERYEREAHLRGQAHTYGVETSTDDATSPEASGEDSGDDEFVPGTRHLPMR